MRIDAVIDKRQVRCPNARGTGYAKWVARFGDIIRWKDPKTGWVNHGRVAGRVHYAPGGGDTPEIRDWLLVVALTDDLTRPMERWVNSAEVIHIFDPQNYGDRDVVKFHAFFYGPEWRKEKSQDLRGWASEGWTTIEDYKADKAGRK